MRYKTLTLYLGLILSLCETAHAQLSANPWLDPNSSEEVEKVYKKSQKKQNHSVTSYTPEAPTTIDQSSAYIEITDEEETKDNSFINKLTKPFTKKEETRLVPNTKDNRKAVMERQEQRAAETAAANDSNTMDAFDFSDYMPKKVSLPKFNTNNLIKRFEKASGVDFKAIARQMRGGK